MFSINPKKLKKIKKDGHFDGKNRQVLDGEGKPLSDIEAMKLENRLRGDMNLLDE